MKQILKYIYSCLVEQLKFAEQKHSIILALNSGIIVVVANMFKGWNSLLIIAYFSIFVFCGLSLMCSISALFSRNIKLKSSKVKAKHNLNLLYFKDIYNLSTSEYLSYLVKEYYLPKNYCCDNFENDLAKQIIANSIVINKKYKLFNYSVIFLSVGILFSLIFFIGVIYV